MFGHYLFYPKSQIFNRDHSKILFHYCLLHFISLRGLGVKTIAKTALKL